MTSVAPILPAPVFDAFDAAHHADPYPVYRRVQRDNRFCPMPMGDAEVTVLTRYDDCAAALLGPDWGHGHASGAGSPFRGEETLIPGSFVRMDPPDHSRFRSLVNKAFTPRTVAALAPDVERVVAELLAAVPADGELDVITDLAVPMTLAIIGGRVMGIPADERSELRGWELAIARGTDPDPLLPADAIVARTAAGGACTAYLRELVARKRAAPTDDLLSMLVGVEQAGERLTEEELVGIGLLLLVAGMETSINLIGNGVLALLAHPDQLTRLRARPDLVGSAVDEVLRYDGSTQFTARVALADTAIDGHRFARGEGVLVVTGAAGRDPSIYADADRFVVDRFAGPRPARRHLGFSLGLHYCVGAPLARVEAEAALGALVRRTPTLVPADLDYLPSFIHRGVRSLPVRLTT